MFLGALRLARAGSLALLQLVPTRGPSNTVFFAGAQQCVSLALCFTMIRDSAASGASFSALLSQKR